MRKKLVSKTYLRDVQSYSLTFFNDSESDFYVVTKKIIKVTEPFILSNGVKVIDDGYYIVEITPKNENYNVRVYLNDKKEIIEHYIDISLGNGLDEDAKIPFYDDLYTDITIMNGEIEILDLDELKEALDAKKISNDDYKLAETTKEKVLFEIRNKTNKYINMKLDDYLLWNIIIW